MASNVTTIDLDYFDAISGTLNTKINSFDDCLRAARNLDVLANVNLSSNSIDLESQILTIKCNLVKLNSTISSQSNMFCDAEIKNANDIESIENLNI